jgi:hypothetical protein
MAATQGRTSAGSFDAAVGDSELLDIIAAVARLASPANPARVTQRVWDRRLAVSKYAGRAPSARACVMRLNRGGASLTWKQVVELSLKEGASRTQGLAAALREELSADLPDHQVYYAMRRVARELGEAPASPARYQRGRDRGLRAGLDAGRLPTANQLVTWAKRERQEWVARSDPWFALLVGTQAEAAKCASTTWSRIPRRPSSRNWGPANFPAAGAALRRRRRVNKKWASRPTLERFCREARVALQARPPGVKWADVIADATALLEKNGLDVPEEPLKPTGRGNRITYHVPAEGLDYDFGDDIESPAPALRVGPGKKPKHAPEPARTKWTAETVVAKLREFDRVVPVSEGRAQRVYRRHLPDHPDWPTVSTVIKRGGWSALLDRAMEKNRPRSC